MDFNTSIIDDTTAERTSAHDQMDENKVSIRILCAVRQYAALLCVRRKKLTANFKKWGFQEADAVKLTAIAGYRLNWWSSGSFQEWDFDPTDDKSLTAIGGLRIDWCKSRL